MPQLRALTVGDDPSGWQQAGFDVADNTTTIGAVPITFDPDAGPGIAAWTLSEVPADAADGLTRLGLTTYCAPTAALTGLFDGISANDTGHHRRPTHANAVERIDHLVIHATDMAAATTAMAAAGFDARHHRPVPHSREPAQQVFYWAGDVIVELVGPMPVEHDQRVDRQTGRAADGTSFVAWFWGLALASTDLDRTVSRFGPRASEPRPAVQPGRSITTIDHHGFAMTVPLAVLSPHPSDTADA